MPDTDALASASAAFEEANTLAYHANLDYGFDPTPAKQAEARRLNKLASDAAYNLHDARDVVAFAAEYDTPNTRRMVSAAAAGLITWAEAAAVARTALSRALEG
jgi:uridylate kinase